MSTGELGSGNCPGSATSISEVLPHICTSGQRDAILPGKKSAAQNSWEKAACLRRVATKRAGCQANWGTPSPTQSCQDPALSWDRAIVSWRAAAAQQAPPPSPAPSQFPCWHQPRRPSASRSVGHRRSVRSSQAEIPAAVKGSGARTPVRAYGCPPALAHLPTRVHARQHPKQGQPVPAHPHLHRHVHHRWQDVSQANVAGDRQDRPLEGKHQAGMRLPVFSSQLGRRQAGQPCPSHLPPPRRG